MLHLQSDHKSAQLLCYTYSQTVSTTTLLHLQSDKSAQLLCYTYSQTTSQHNYCCYTYSQTISQHNYFVTLIVRQSAQLLCYTYSQTTSQHNYFITLIVRQSAHYSIRLTVRPKVSPQVGTTTLLHLQ